MVKHGQLFCRQDYENEMNMMVFSPKSKFIFQVGTVNFLISLCIDPVVNKIAHRIHGISVVILILYTLK